MIQMREIYLRCVMEGKIGQRIAGAAPLRIEICNARETGRGVPLPEFSRTKKNMRRKAGWPEVGTRLLQQNNAFGVSFGVFE